MCAPNHSHSCLASPSFFIILYVTLVIRPHVHIDMNNTILRVKQHDQARLFACFLGHLFPGDSQ